MLSQMPSTRKKIYISHRLIFSTTKRILQKKNWSDQYYFIAKDSERNHLDSLFRYEMHKINKYTSTAIGYVYNGKKYNSGDEKFIRKAILVQEYKYRKDY